MEKLIFLLIFCLARAYDKVYWRNTQISEKQGPNVCAVESIDDIDYTYYTDYTQWAPRKICRKDTFLKPVCCAGYYKISGVPGCVGVKPLVNIIATARKAGATKFARLIEITGFANELSYGPAVTLFAPSDESFDHYLRMQGVQLEWLHNDARYINLVANHFISKRLLSNQWQADTVLETKLSGHILRINRYTNSIETVNCKNIVRKNWEATNGVVHIIDGVLEPVSSQNSDIIDLALRDGRFGIFLNALETSGLIRKIRSNDIAYTIFAPTDDAFRRIRQRTLNRILSDRQALDALIAHHIVKYPICASSIISQHRVSTMQGDELTLNCAFPGAVVEETRIREASFNGKDGLLYKLDNVLLPDRVKTVLELAQEEGLFTFLQIIRVAGLEIMLNDLNDFTIFIPTETAMYSMPSRQLMELKRNRELAKHFILNHVAIGRHLTDEMTTNRMGMSLDRRVRFRFQVYRGSFGVENALIRKADKEGSNGVLHVISHILQHPQNSLYEILRNDGNFSIWLRAMDQLKNVQPDLYHDFESTNSSCTYFVPTDEAFRNLEETDLDYFMKDKYCLTKTFQNHMAESMMISEGFKSDLRYTVRTKENPLNIMKTDNRLMINGAPLLKCDVLNKNGVAHEMNTVLLPNQCTHNYRRKRIANDSVKK